MDSSIGHEAGKEIKEGLQSIANALIVLAQSIAGKAN